MISSWSTKNEIFISYLHTKVTRIFVRSVQILSTPLFPAYHSNKI